MKMACLGGHFPILIHKDTREDHERNIGFSWNPNLFLNGGEDKLCQDGNGHRLCGKWNPNIIPNGAKDNSSQNEDGGRLSCERSRHPLDHFLSNPS